MVLPGPVGEARRRGDATIVAIAKTQRPINAGRETVRRSGGAMGVLVVPEGVRIWSMGTSALGMPDGVGRDVLARWACEVTSRASAG